MFNMILIKVKQENYLFLKNTTGLYVINLENEKVYNINK
jgi:hypothetical protein